MPFQSGRVSFARFQVDGDAPVAVDQAVLATLAEHSFQESEITTPDETESGFTAGDHLLDTQFSFEKNGYGASSDLLLFDVRIDTHRVPAEVRHAYRRIQEMELAKENPSGFATKAQKREAADTAARQAHDDMVAGKYRRSKVVHLLWDLSARTLYTSSGSDKAVEQVASLMRQAFNVDLTLMTAGTVAGRSLRDTGKGRDYEDLRPSAFTPPPPQAGQDRPEGARDQAHPTVPWIAMSTDTKDFLGNEFLIWLWWITETAEGLVELPNATGTGSFTIAVAIDKALDMDCAWGVMGRQSLRSGSMTGAAPTRMPEAGKALALGKWPRKMTMLLADTADGQQWELSMQGDRWVISSATLPEVPDANSPRDLIDARLQLTRQLADTLDGLMGVFVKARTAPTWPNQRKAMREWITKRPH